MYFDFKNMPGLKKHDFVMDSQVPALVSIITPFYNAGRYFEQTYNCVINQTFPWFEWIIVDDGSTSEADILLLQNLSLKDKRIKTYRKENGGIASARNLGISMSSTDFIVPLDADDLISPVYLEINYWALKFAPDATWSYTDSVGFGTQEYLWKKSFSSQKMCMQNFLTCTAMIRKRDFFQVGNYSELNKHFNEDWHAWLKLLAARKFPLHLSGYYFWYRRTNQGVLAHVRKTSTDKKISRKLIEEQAQKVPKDIFAKEFPIPSKVNIYATPHMSDFPLKKKDSLKPSLLLLFPWMEMGGADAFNLAFVKYARRLFEVGIITTNFSNNSWKQRFESVCDDIFSLPDFLEVINYAEFISYYILSRNVKILVISNSYYGYYLIPWLRCNFPELTIVDYVHMEEWYWRNGGYARTSGVFGDFLNKTFVCNRHTKEVLEHDFLRKSGSIEISYIGVDTDYYNPATIEAGKIRSQYHLENSKIILFPCRLDHQKRPILALEIIAHLKTLIPEAMLLVVGDGPLREDFLLQVQKRNLQQAVLFVGAQHDMRPFYKDCDLTLICSIKEGLSLTSYESLSMGVPVISSDVGGQKDLIDETVGGLISTNQAESDIETQEYDFNEIFSYVKRISEILNDSDLYDALSQNASAKVVHMFSQKNTLTALVENLFQLISRSETIEFNKNMKLSSEKYSSVFSDYLTLYSEIENYVNSYNYGLNSGEKQELLRIVNSSWGQRLLKLAFKLHLNRLFH